MKAKIAIIAASAVLLPLMAACERKQMASSEKPAIVKGAQIGQVRSSAVDDFYEATGTVRSRTITILSSKVMGSIAALGVREGDRVRSGQVLVEIDNRDARTHAQSAQARLSEAQNSAEEVERNIRAAEAAKTSAEANRTLAQATFNRYQTLLERKSASPQEFDEVQAKHRMAEAEFDRADKMLGAAVARKNQALARIEQAKAEVANAEVFVSYARITSPINGVVTARHSEVGSTAIPGAPLLTLEESSRYRLEIAAQESQLGKLRLGERARVVIDAIGAGELSGTVVEIVPTADPASRSFTVKIELPAVGALRSGLYGKARFVIGQKQAIAVPRNAIVERGQLVSVFVVNEAGIAHLRLIKTGKTYGDQIEALSGLNDGERIVIDGVQAVTDGSRVQ